MPSAEATAFSGFNTKISKMGKKKKETAKYCCATLWLFGAILVGHQLFHQLVVQLHVIDIKGEGDIGH